MKRGDTCYRKDSGTQSIDAVEGEDAASAAGDETGSADDVSLDAGPEAVDAGLQPGPRDMSDASIADTGMPAVDAAPPDAAPPFDGGGGNDAAATDAGTVTCASQPCQNGGSCTNEPSGFRCSCPEPFTGERCESKVCPTLYLRTPDDLAKAQSCGEIRGDLSVASAGIASITASDLPYLTKITGNLNVTAMVNSVEAPRLQRLTLAALRGVDGELAVIFTGSGSVEEIRFPSLTRVGTSGQQRAISFGATDTKLLDLSALTTVNGYFHVNRLYYLCSLYIGKLATVTGDVQLDALHNLTPSAVERLIEAATTEPVVREIGCCASESLSCETYAGQTRCGC